MTKLIVKFWVIVVTKMGIFLAYSWQSQDVFSLQGCTLVFREPQLQERGKNIREFTTGLSSIYDSGLLLPISCGQKGYCLYIYHYLIICCAWMWSWVHLKLDLSLQYTGLD